MRQRLRIVIAEDHALMRDGLRSIFDNDPEIEFVASVAGGREAIQVVGDTKPDIVIMDVGMSDMNGVEATREIVRQHPAIRVIALSRHRSRRYVVEMLRAGACGYVLKTNAYTELRRAIMAAAQGRSFLSDAVADLVVEEVRTPVQGPKEPSKLLGPREREVLQLLAEGLSSAEIAERLHISPSTVDTHRRNLMKKLDLHSVAALTKYAIREGLTSVDD